MLTNLHHDTVKLPAPKRNRNAASYDAGTFILQCTVVIDLCARDRQCDPPNGHLYRDADPAIRQCASQGNDCRRNEEGKSDKQDRQFVSKGANRIIGDTNGYE